jgi:hypothetical protein
MNKIKDRTNFPVKLAAERALMHVLEIHQNQTTLKDYVAKLDSATAKTLQDYCSRVLAKLPPQSEEENDEEEK